MPARTYQFTYCDRFANPMPLPAILPAAGFTERAAW